MTTAEQKLFDAMDASHKKTWGDIADKVDWYGIPLRHLPQDEREIIQKRADYIRTINHWLVTIERGTHNDK